jgi:hypothetical protein
VIGAVAKNKASKAKRAAEGAWGNPYVQRVAQDPELRDNVRVAYDAARSAYARLSNGKPAAKVVMDDKRFQKELRQAADALKDAGSALRDGPKRRRRKGGIGRLLVIGIVGAGLAVALSEDVRSKVLDALFGKEEEFDYTSTTAPASAPPTSVPSAG